MKKLFFIFLISIFYTYCYSQQNWSDTTQNKVNENKTHNIIGLIPSNARVTNGWAIGYDVFLEESFDGRDSIRINGLYTNICPLQIFIAGFFMFAYLSPDALNSYKDDTIKTYDTIVTKHKLNGVSFGLFEYGENFTMNGLQLSILYHQMGKLNGFSTSLLSSYYKEFKGVMISGIYNDTYIGKGIQIGLINNSEKFRGIQIGLINQIGAKAFPIINIRLKKIK